MSKGHKKRKFTEAEPKQRQKMNIHIDYKKLSNDLAKVLYEEGAKKDKEGHWKGEHRIIKGYTPEPMTAELWNYILTISHDSYMAGVERVIKEFNSQEKAKVTRAQRRAIKNIEKLAGADHNK